MIVYNVLNDICNDGYDIYVYYQDIEHLYSYLMFVFWHRVGSDARSGGSARDSARDRDRVSDWISEFV